MALVCLLYFLPKYRETLGRRLRITSTWKWASTQARRTFRESESAFSARRVISRTRSETYIFLSFALTGYKRSCRTTAENISLVQDSLCLLLSHYCFCAYLVAKFIAFWHLYNFCIDFVRTSSCSLSLNRSKDRPTNWLTKEANYLNELAIQTYLSRNRSFP